MFYCANLTVNAIHMYSSQHIVVLTVISVPIPFQQLDKSEVNNDVL